MQVGTSLSHRAPLLWLALPFAGGIAIAHATASPVPIPAVAAGCLVLLAVAGLLLRTRQRRSSLVAVAVAIAGLGMIHHETHRARLPDWDRLPQREAELIVEVKRIFNTRVLERPLSVIGMIRSADPHLSDLIGQSLYVQAWRYHDPTAVERGATIRIRGHLTPLPRAARGDGFNAYLIDAGINFRLTRGRLLEVVNGGSGYAVWRQRIKTVAMRQLARDLEAHPDLVGALQAMLLGDRTGLDEEDKSVFLRSGTMHLFAISGLHIGVIAVALHGALRLMRLPPGQTFVISTLLLAVYVDLVGGTPSAVRAWLMVTCVHASVALRAPGNAVAAIGGSMLLVLLLDPLQLFSAGFQMSYGIVFALLLYGLPLGEHLQSRIRPWRDLPETTLTGRQKFARRRLEGLIMAGALGWAAMMVGLISGVAIFGWFTPIAFVANLALMPMASLAILGGLIAMISGGLGLIPLALLGNHAAALVLLIVNALLGHAVAWPIASTAASFRHPAWGEFGLVAMLAIITIGYVQGWPSRPRSWWWPPIALVLVLVTGMRLG
ncbi:ComEC/Rec2 family competence protein [Synoicihabitans lomoniglobus]|uniref:ComEC/Rec2 family competence protein n=1 Tax=Synoicihabitans lomoniglobus TaxID=2909285 RepID=A0AAE9ZWY4_9BACT|nr:ComEC family competence protein [Opitutaceae bacterium LMO-M01]WED64961.1 ComEC/Rec2 family competence protein [Opitutaceae bacterium LMO-M01]